MVIFMNLSFYDLIIEKEKEKEFRNNFSNNYLYRY